MPSGLDLHISYMCVYEHVAMCSYMSVHNYSEMLYKCLRNQKRESMHQWCLILSMMVMERCDMMVPSSTVSNHTASRGTSKVH